MSKLNDYIAARGISIGELSRRTGLDKRTISRLIHGKYGGHIDTWKIIAEKLGCKIGDILD